MNSFINSEKTCRGWHFEINEFNFISALPLAADKQADF